MSKEVLTQAEEKMNKSIDAFSRELATIRAGRANPSLLDRVQVEYYGALTPLNQLATVSVPEGRTLMITPFDKSSIQNIEKGIQKADLGLSPNNDGNVIRITIPALTDERRKELIKIIGRYAEEAKVAIRNVRRETNDDLKKKQKDNEMTEDEHKRAQDDVQKLTDKKIALVDQYAKDKEDEVKAV
ncbi:ribosome recycling factor [Alkalicoccus urumqiensis]|uniref:Ribosome-recycling factor n=1 Tax=Alkalicoccus urumqiensis TaxID=1548213 RepID=A0A2P6MG37_ALKUR|nr:ribosome recycling factor [Alkalicoccus urumqiensis]PRO65200.1 ribosome recycling factor [Alkalicoccus urumqiensis]